MYPEYDRVIALEIEGVKRPFDTLNRALIEKLGVTIGLPATEVNRSLEALAKPFGNSKTLQLANHVQPDDFRFRYRAIIHENAARIFA